MPTSSSSPMRYYSWLTANVLLPISILLFAVGFFPYKPFIPGLATLEDDDNDAIAGGGEGGNASGGALAEPVFDKVIYMVVDALRSDFVYSNNSGFLFLQSLIRSGAALPFTAHAGPPTITMPRVKAMTTGSVPSFVDVILNFAESDTTSTLSHQDTWLAQIKARRPASKLLMYGDDTWLKLFPNFFDRHDGTSSFFVSDFVEVDNNVTRHIPEELAQSDWTAVIMHYLGLDHIGHKAGPGSPHMIPKQREMDGIVEQVYTSMTTEPHLSSTLFVLCGDHGMNDGGNHGGSSPGETSPALVFISPHLQKLQEGKENLQSPLRASEDFQFYDKVEQSDIAPTLAGLLDLAVPLNSLGVFIPSLLRLWDDRPWKKVLVLLANARQLLNIVKMKFPHGEFDEAVSREECEVSNGSEAGDLACLWSRAMTAVERGSRNKSLIPDACDALLAFSRKAQRVMSNVASNYNVRYMMIAIGLGVVAIGLSVFAAYAALRQSAFASAYFLATSFAYVGMMFASSYVEEEQQFWHWILSGWNLYLLVKCWSRGRGDSKHNNKPSSSFFLSSSSSSSSSSNSRTVQRIGNMFHASAVLLGLNRLIRRWNQTGQKHTGEPDVVDYLSVRPRLLWALIAWSYIGVLYRIVQTCSGGGSGGGSQLQSRRWVMSFSEAIIAGMSVMAVTVSFLFKVAFTHAQSPELTTVIEERIRGVVCGYMDLSLVVQCQVAFILMGVTVMVGYLISWEEEEEEKEEEKEKGTENENENETRNRASSRHIDTCIRKRHLRAVLVREMISLFLMTQSRAENIPLFQVYEEQIRVLQEMGVSGIDMMITSLIQQYTSFFAFGGSNSIASIDLSSAYNGISRYDVVVVGTLTFVGNWAGGIWWVAATMMEETRGNETMKTRTKTRTKMKTKTDQWEKQSVMTVFVSVSMVAVMVACMSLRTHLFIWSVFSPKFLYSMAWTMGHYLGVHVIVGGMMRRWAI